MLSSIGTRDVLQPFVAQDVLDKRHLFAHHRNRVLLRQEAGDLLHPVPQPLESRHGAQEAKLQPQGKLVAHTHVNEGVEGDALLLHRVTVPELQVRSYCVIKFSM